MALTLPKHFVTVRNVFSLLFVSTILFFFSKKTIEIPFEPTYTLILDNTHYFLFLFNVQIVFTFFFDDENNLFIVIRLFSSHGVCPRCSARDKVSQHTGPRLVKTRLCHDHLLNAAWVWEVNRAGHGH